MFVYVFSFLFVGLVARVMRVLLSGLFVFVNLLFCSFVCCVTRAVFCGLLIFKDLLSDFTLFNI